MATDTQELVLPTDVDTATAMLNDPAEIGKWLRAGKFTDIQNRYNELTRPPLADQITDILEAREAANGTVANAAKAAMDEWFKERGANASISRPDLGDRTEKRSIVRNEYAKRIEEIGFTNLGDFAREIWHKNPVKNRTPQISQVMNDFSSVDPSLGGALIPESMDSEIRRLVLEQSIVRRFATTVTMQNPTMLFPYVDWTTNVGSTFGGWVVNRVAEGEEIPASNTKFGRAKLDVTKQAARARVPNELFVDVAALDGFIRTTLPQAQAFAEDVDFLTGDGVGKPLGVLNSPAKVTVTKETNQPNATVQVENILKMYARMLPSSKGRGVWLVNPTTFAQLMTLSIAVGTGGAPVALVNIAASPTPTMLGRPVIETEKVPALGAAGDIGFFDFSYYLIGDRPGSGLESSPHEEFSNDVTVLKMTSRNDGRPWIQSALTPLNGDSLSPFVVLGARA
jgi:HK97 family phage major capsid protein